MAMCVAELKWAGRGWWAGGGGGWNVIWQNGGMKAEGGATIGGDCCEVWPKYAAKEKKTVLHFPECEEEYQYRGKISEFKSFSNWNLTYNWIWVSPLSNHLNIHCQDWGVRMLKIDTITVYSSEFIINTVYHIWWNFKYPLSIHIIMWSCSKPDRYFQLFTFILILTREGQWLSSMYLFLHTWLSSPMWRLSFYLSSILQLDHFKSQK